MHPGHWEYYVRSLMFKTFGKCSSWVTSCSVVSVSAPYLECLYLMFPMLVELSARDLPVGGPGNNAVYDEVHTRPAWGEAWNLQIVLWGHFPERLTLHDACAALLFPKASSFSSHLECWGVVWPKVLLCLLLNSVCCSYEFPGAPPIIVAATRPPLFSSP